MYANKSNQHQRAKAFSFTKQGEHRSCDKTTSSSLKKHKSIAASLKKRHDLSSDKITSGDQTDDFIKSNYTSNTSTDQVMPPSSKASRPTELGN